MSFLAWRQVLPHGVSMRAETPSDREFLAALYASTREEELRPVPWPEAQKRDFLDAQFELQRTHYRRYYAAAEWLVLVRGGAPIGRLYVHTTRAEVRLIDVALAPAERNRGIGTQLMANLIGYADALGLPLSLHVEPFNRALALYERLGFVTRETRGIYLYMERSAPAHAAARREPDQLNVIS
jgi:ribosomal protein S18 acetylase RimI-like enzyme